MMILRILSRLRHDRRGAAVVLLGASLMGLTGAAAVAVDVGSLFLAKRQLQGVADAAALAAAQSMANDGGAASAQALIDRSGVPNVALTGITPGQYVRDATVPAAARFQAVSTAPTAARVTVERTVPLFFGRLLTGKQGLIIRTLATAARVDMAAFSIGTRLVGLSGGIANQLLSALAGTNLNLSLVETGQLASANIDLLHFADALRVRLNMQGSSYADVFGTPVPLQQIVRAMADAAPDGYSGTILSGIAGQMPNTAITLSQLIDLGPMGTGSASGNAGLVQVDLFSFLRSLLGAAQGNSYTATLNVAVPGLTSVKLILAGGNSASSPWLTVTRARDIVVRTGAARIYLDARVAVILPGIASLRVPVYIELAASEARLSDIRCNGDALNDGVSLSVTPSAGSIAIADVDSAAIPDFSTVPAKAPATLVNILGTRVNAYADIALGGLQSQNVWFSKADIAAHRTRTVTTKDLTNGIATTLAQNIQISTTILGITLNAGPLVSAVAGQLLSVTPLLDTLLNEVTGILGVKIGAADVRVDGLRCGVPMLVA
jgi:uncharacterized membrane protein